MIILLGFLAYSNTFDVPFVFDDDLAIRDNPKIKDISNVLSMFVLLDGPWASRPLLHASNALNYYFGGMDASGYHAVNLLLHILNGILLYSLVMTTGRLMCYEEKGIRYVAFASSLVFVLHPMQTEGVTYIISRSILFSTCFFFSGILFFVRAVTSEKRRAIYVTGLFLVSLLGMASRENFATFPVVLFLYDLFFVSKFRLRESASHYKAHMAALLSLGYMTYLVLTNTYAPSGSYPGDEGMPHAEYVLTQFRVHWTYMRMLVLPFNQSIDHGYTASRSLFDFPTLISFVGYAGLLSLSIVMARKRPVMAFGFLWFIIILAPISFLVALLDLRLHDVLFEHRAYLPNAGIIVLAVTAGAMLIKRINSRNIMTAAIVCAAALPVVLGSATYARNSVWANTTSIWEDAVSKAPGNWRGRYNLGNEYREAGFLERAVEQYREAIRLNPDYAKTYNNLGISYKGIGQHDEALEQYFLALRRDQGLVETYNNIANIYMIKESYDIAIGYYETALKLRPDSAEAHYNIGNALFYKGQYDKAAEHYRASLNIKPGDAKAHNNLGVAYLMLGQKELALNEVETALRLDPGLKEARESLEEIRNAYETAQSGGN